jgi:hypothetical protein
MHFHLKIPVLIRTAKRALAAIPALPAMAAPLVIAVLAAAAVPVRAQEGALFRVKCGGEGFVDKAGHIWEADAHYEGGQTFAAANEITNTDIPFLYQSERWNDAASGNLKYTFPVRAGEYRINLHFAEIYDVAFAPGIRVFDVKVNETVVAADLDVFAQAGANTPLILDFLAAASDGIITVEFINKIGNAKISGIEVIPQNPFRATAAPYRIHCGGEDYIDAQGNWWEGDGHNNGGIVYVSANPVGNTEKSFIYQTERYNATGDLTYSFDVAPGAYDVQLHFAEIFFQAAGERVFSIDINGQSAIENLDVLAEAGPNTALVKRFSATDADGKIVIGFRNGVEKAKISGIEILPASPTRARSPRGAYAAAEGPRIQGGTGSLQIGTASGEAFTATVRDFAGKRIALMQGSGKAGEAKAVTGLRTGVYLVEVRAGKRVFQRSVPVF